MNHLITLGTVINLLKEDANLLTLNRGHEVPEHLEIAISKLEELRDELEISKGIKNEPSVERPVGDSCNQ